MNEKAISLTYAEVVDLIDAIDSAIYHAPEPYHDGYRDRLERIKAELQTLYDI